MASERVLSLTSIGLKTAGMILGFVAFLAIILVLADYLNVGFRHTRYGDFVIPAPILLILTLASLPLLAWGSFQNWSGLNWVNRLWVALPLLCAFLVILKSALLLKLAYARIVTTISPEAAPILYKQASEFTMLDRFTSPYIVMSWITIVLIMCIASTFFLYTDAPQKPQSKTKVFVASFGVVFAGLATTLGSAWMATLLDIIHADISPTMFFQALESAVSASSFLMLEVMPVYVLLIMGYTLWKIQLATRPNHKPILPRKAEL